MHAPTTYSKGFKMSGNSVLEKKTGSAAFFKFQYCTHHIPVICKGQDIAARAAPHTSCLSSDDITF
jgi:hypothetical protein